MGTGTATTSTSGVRMTLRGDLDLSDTSMFASLTEYASVADQDVVVDLSEVTFSDSQLIKFLAGLGEALTHRLGVVTVLPGRAGAPTLDVLRLVPLPGNVLLPATVPVPHGRR